MNTSSLGATGRSVGLASVPKDLTETHYLSVFSQCPTRFTICGAILTYKTSHLKHELITGLLEKNSKVINIAINNVYAIDSLKHGLMQEKSTNRATEILVLFYETWINTFCKSNSGGAGVDGVEDSFIAYLRL